MSTRAAAFLKVTSLDFFFTGDDPLGGTELCVFRLDAVLSLSMSMTMGVVIFAGVICRVVCVVFLFCEFPSGVVASCHVMPIPAVAGVA